MILYYVRHGDPIYDPDSLTELGHKQAAALAKRLAKYGLDEIYSSPSNRARLTAKPTCDALGLDMKICEWADEAKAAEDTGIINKEGKWTWSFADSEMADKFNHPSVRALDMQWYKHEYFQGLPFEKGIKRINAAVDEWLLSLGYKHDRENCRYEKVGNSPQKVALFAHHGASMLIMSSILDIPYPMFSTRTCIGHTGVSVIAFGDDGHIYPQIFQYSNDSHLYKEDLLTGYNNSIDI